MKRIALLSVFTFHFISLCSCATFSASQPKPAPLATNEIYLGMQRSQVVRAWGEPREVLWAGSESSGSEKWVYSSQFYGSGYGADLASNQRVLYFENGRLVGWETR